MQRKDMRLDTIYRIDNTQVGHIIAFGSGREDHAVEVYDYISQTFIPRKPVPSRDIDPLVLSRDGVLELEGQMETIAEVRRDRQYLDAFNAHYGTDAKGISARVTDVRQNRSKVSLLLCEYEAVFNPTVRTGSANSVVTLAPDDFRALVDGRPTVEVPEPVLNVAPPQYGGLLDTVHLDQLRRERDEERRKRNRALSLIKQVEERFKAEHEAKVAAGERKPGYYSPNSQPEDRERIKQEVCVLLKVEGLFDFAPYPYSSKQVLT